MAVSVSASSFVPVPGLRRLRARRALVVSAGGVRSGIQGLYLGVSGDEWEILSSALLPYPQKVLELIDRLSETQDPVALSDIGWLDYKVTMLFLIARGRLSPARRRRLGSRTTLS